MSKKKLNFSDARKTMGQILFSDAGLYESYKANIAMLLSDAQETNINHPIDYKDADHRNEMAMRILKLIFK